MTDPAARVGDVATPARDYMNVRVRDGLSGRIADVDADVVAVWGNLTIEDGSDFVDQAQDIELFAL